MHYQKEQLEIAFFSVLLDSIWIVFVTGIMWLIYIVPILLWSSKHFMGTLINPKAELGIWQLLSSLYGLGDSSLKDVIVQAFAVFRKQPMGLTIMGTGEEDFLLYVLFIYFIYCYL